MYILNRNWLIISYLKIQSLSFIIHLFQSTYLVFLIQFESLKTALLRIPLKIFSFCYPHQNFLCYLTLRKGNLPFRTFFMYLLILR
jgi:hypothetical protein